MFKYQPLLPYVHLAYTHVMNVPKPSVFFVGFLLPCIITNGNEMLKMGLGIVHYKHGTLSVI